LKCCPSSHGDTINGVAVATALVCALGMLPASAQLNCNPGIDFYDNGPMKQCNLNGDHRLYTVRGDVVVCGNGHPLVQFPDGRLRSCTLVDTSVIAGVRCDAPARIEIAHDGGLLGCVKT
jgi:hypothetical protein